jgi:ankyrin repeat protein
MEGAEQMEVTPHGPVLMIPVRANVNQRAMTCEMLMNQKKELHIQAFEYGVDELRRQLLEQEERFARRFAQDNSSSFPSFRGYSLDRFVDSIMDECRLVLEKHRQCEPMAIHDDNLNRLMVHEMLSALRMARSKLDLYLEDSSRYLYAMMQLPMRFAHRERMAALYRQVKIGESMSEDSRRFSLQLCKEEGLVTDAVEEQNEQGESKIMEAAADEWKPSHIRLLVAAGADVNDMMIDGTTPTMQAAKCGHTATVTELHALGADVNSTTFDGYTAVMSAAEGGHKETVKELHALGADVNAATSEGGTAVMSAAQGGHTATVKELHALGANIQAAASDGYTAVMSAARGGHTATVKELHALGADVKAAKRDGHTAVMYAAQGGHTATVKELHALGADVKAAKNDDWTAVMLAEQAGHSETADLLRALSAIP